MQLPQCFCCTYTFAAQEACTYAYVHDLRGIATRGHCRETLDVLAIIQNGNPELCGNGLASFSLCLASLSFLLIHSTFAFSCCIYFLPARIYRTIAAHVESIYQRRTVNQSLFLCLVWRMDYMINQSALIFLHKTCFLYHRIAPALLAMGPTQGFLRPHKISYEWAIRPREKEERPSLPLSSFYCDPFELL